MNRTTITLETYGPYNEDKDIYLNKWFDVPTSWLMTHLSKRYSTLDDFLNEYTWDETLFVYEEALADGVVTNEREV